MGSVAHPNVVGGAAIDNILPLIFGIRAADRLSQGRDIRMVHVNESAKGACMVREVNVKVALTAPLVIIEIELLRDKVVRVLFVIDCPVVGVGDDRDWPHVLVNPLWEIQYLDLYGLMMALFPPVPWAVVVLVPVLNFGPATKGRILYERHDRPVFADELIACRDEPRGVEHLEHLRNAGCHRPGCQAERHGIRIGGVPVVSGVTLFFSAEGFFLLLVEPVVDVGGDAEIFWC